MALGSRLVVHGGHDGFPSAHRGGNPPTVTEGECMARAAALHRPSTRWNPRTTVVAPRRRSVTFNSLIESVEDQPKHREASPIVIRPGRWAGGARRRQDQIG